VEAAYSDELLKTAKLHGQLSELQLLRTQNTMYACSPNKIWTNIYSFCYYTRSNEEKLAEEQSRVQKLEATAQETEAELEQLQQKKQELLSINKEMSELIVSLQNDICLAESKVSSN